MRFSKVLSIETSCDDTSVAIVRQDAWVEAVVSAHQNIQHAPFGGVVPEIASRNHTLQVLPLVEEALAKAQANWSSVDGIAVTNRPGLLGSLLVGVVIAKTLAQARKLPFIGVNHLEGHIMAPFLCDREYAPQEGFNFPMIILAVSGGHTTIYRALDFGRYEVLGTTQDDAAGEAFDKFGKRLGFGFPGGVKVDHMSRGGRLNAYAFPRALLREDHLAMSFSGLKSAAHRLVAAIPSEELPSCIPDLCASFQEAIVDVLLEKLDRAVKINSINNISITGGVSANSRLRERAQHWAAQRNLCLQIPPLRYCTDNAAMIGLVGIRRMNMGQTSPLSMGPSASSWVGDFL